MATDCWEGEIKMNLSRKHNPEKVCKSSPELLGLFEAARDGILLINAKTGKVTFVNRSFVEMSGYGQEEILGKKLPQIKPLESADANLIIAKSLQNRESVHLETLPLETKDRGRILAELFCSTHPIERGKIIQCNFRNVTERKRIDEELHRSEEQFRYLFENNPYPMWIYDINSLVFLAVNDATIGVYGFSRDEFTGMTVKDLCLPEDIADQINTGQSRQGSYVKPDVWKHRKKNGDLIEVEMTTHDIQFNSRNARFVVAVDVTARRQAEKLLKDTRQLLHEVLNALPVGVWVTDNKGDIIMGNPASKRIWGGEEFPGVDRYSEYKNWWPDTGIRIEANEWALTRAITKGETVLDDIMDIEGFDGAKKTILNSAVPLRGSQGNIKGAIVVNQDITERRRQEEELKRVHAILERQATTDTLTGVYNRHKFNELLDREVQEALRYQHTLSLIMFDIDHFKKVNDTYGHIAGDVVLKEVAGLVSENIRKVDIFARWGGEEFLILSPNNAFTSAQQLAEKLRTQIENNKFNCPVTVTCSFGLTQFEEGDTIDSLIKRADYALYLAKERGRNRVEIG